MRHLLRVIRRRVGPVVGVCALLAGGIGGCVVAGAGIAQATACPGTPVVAGTTCTDTGTLTFTAGTLTLTSPTALAWTATDTGLNQQVVDLTTAQQAYTVDDATGSGAGWHVTVSASQFTSTTPVATLSGTTTLSTNGSVASQAATTAPTGACTVGAAGCTVPTNTTTYPVAITTTAVTIYDTAAASGLGSITVGLPGAAAVGWWVALPANAVPSTSGYISTVTLEVITAP
jgi:hypothetical protein